MSWRTVVITGITKLDYRMGYLVVRKQLDETRVHLSEIGMLIIESTTVSLTTALLAEIVKKKTKVIFCDEKHNPISELCSYYGSHNIFNYKFFILVNLNTFFAESDVSIMEEFVRYENVSVLFVSGNSVPLNNISNRHIIDKDLCEI